MEKGMMKRSLRQLGLTIAAGLLAGMVLAAPKALDFYQATHPEQTTVIDNTGGPTAARCLALPFAKRVRHHSI